VSSSLGGKRIAGRSQTLDVERWLNSQSNINTSLNNVISHMVRIFGYRDIMDYEVQSFLFHKISSTTMLGEENLEKLERNSILYNMHTIYTGAPGTGKTHALKRLTMLSGDEFIIIIDKYNEFHDDVEMLREKGYEVVSIDKDMISQEQFKVAFENKEVKREKVIHITTSEDVNGFDIVSARKLLSSTFKEAREKGIKTRYYIDGHVSFMNQLPEELCKLGRAYNCLVFAAFIGTADIKPDIMNQFYIQDFKTR